MDQKKHNNQEIGYGAEAINPYLVFDTISSLVKKEDYKLSETNFIKAYHIYDKDSIDGVFFVYLSF